MTKCHWPIVYEMFMYDYVFLYWEWRNLWYNIIDVPVDYQVNKVYFQNKTKMKYIWLTIQKRVSITRCLERWFLSQVLVLRAQFNFLYHTYAVHQCYRILYCSQGTLKFVFRHNNSLNIYKVHTSCTLIFRHFLFKGKMLFKENLISS